LTILPSGWKAEDLCPYPNLRRKLGLALAFMLFGSVACVSGVALLVADNDPNPRSAFAFAPPQPASRPIITSAITIERPAVDAVSAPNITAANGITPCPINATGEVNGNCKTAAAQKRLNAAPAARVETDYRNVPAGVPEQVALVANTPPPVGTVGTTPESTDAPSPPSMSAEPVPAASSKPKPVEEPDTGNPHARFDVICPACLPVKPVGEPDAGNPHVRFEQKTARHQSRRRNSYDGFSLFAFDQRGRPRFRPLFW